MIVLTAMAITAAIGCNSSVEENHQEEKHSEMKHSEDEGEVEKTHSISLNNGEKWQINEEMRPYLTTSDSLLNDFEIQEDDHKRLAEVLTENNNKLIKSCSMQGKSHDELHKWLHPHISLVKKLSTVESKREAEMIVEELKASNDTFEIYFQ